MSPNGTAVSRVSVGFVAPSNGTSPYQQMNSAPSFATAVSVTEPVAAVHASAVGVASPPFTLTPPSSVSFGTTFASVSRLVQCQMTVNGPFPTVNVAVAPSPDATSSVALEITQLSQVQRTLSGEDGSRPVAPTVCVHTSPFLTIVVS